MSWFKRYADAVAKLRVPCGFVMVASFAWLSRPSVESMCLGLPVSLAGLALRGWAAGHLEKNRQLARGGPYAMVRNPLYVGTSLVAAGLAIASRRWLLAGIFAAVFLLVYLPVIELEEQHLRDLFPEFGEYARQVPALVPRLRRGLGAGRFRWSLYRHNREYEAGLGLLAGVLYLFGKAWFSRG